jgi:GNAT superfamily N-acetyltransferase
MIRLLEELSLNAWPALQTVLYDGWLLRFANGYTRRANSVQALYPSTLDLEEKIAYCEAMYGAHGLNTVFKPTGIEQPPDFEVALVQRGYILDAPTSVQTCSLLDFTPAEPSAGVEIESIASEEWLKAFCRLRNLEDRYLPTMQTMLRSIVPQAGFFRLLFDNEIAAVGMGVIEGGYVGLYDIITDSRLQKRGLGTQFIHSIVRWARRSRVHTAYLGVMQSNTPALNLYHKLGFREVYRYWYRRKEM